MTESRSPRTEADPETAALVKALGGVAGMGNQSYVRMALGVREGLRELGFDVAAAPRSGEGLDADIDPTPIIEIVEDVLQEHGYKAGPRMTNTANDMGARLADRLRR